MLWLFDPQFQQAYPVMVILAIGLLARAALGPADVVLNMLGGVGRCRRTPSSCGQEGCCAGLE
jgi:O-antigen/teichoic acid export membrane protein